MQHYTLHILDIKYIPISYCNTTLNTLMLILLFDITNFNCKVYTTTILLLYVQYKMHAHMYIMHMETVKPTYINQSKRQYN